MSDNEKLVERIHGEVLAVYTDGHDHTVSDLHYHARRIIALVTAHRDAEIAGLLLDYKTLNEGVSKSFDRADGARTHLIRAVVAMLNHIGIEPRGLEEFDANRAHDLLTGLAQEGGSDE